MPLFCKQYVDDTFLAFRKQEHIAKFFEYLNTKYPNIAFTMKNETNNKISFLDTKVTKIMNEKNTTFNLWYWAYDKE